MRQRPQETLQYASEILSFLPKDRRAALLHAVGLMAAGRGKLARAELTQLIKESPQYVDAQLQLGLLALAEKNYAEASEIFGKVRGGVDPRAAVGLSATYSSRNESERAFQSLTDALKTSPNSSLIHGQLAYVAVRAEKYDLAIAEYRTMVSNDPKSVQQRLRLGEAYELKGDYNKAVETYKQALELSPKDDPVSSLSLAAAMAKAGHTIEAKGQYESVLRSHPDNLSALNNLAFLLSETGGDLDEALRLAQRASGKAPEQPNFADTLGCIYLKSGKRDSANQTFANLVRKYPKYPTFRYHLGMALLEKGDRAGAKKELESALANHPSRDEEAKIKELVSKIG
jgi:tetratricopeptide (TPR) repeat protein